MGSKGIASYNDPDDGKDKPPKKELPTRFVQEFRKRLAAALGTVDPVSDLRLRDCVGIYAFYDYDDEPIYVGQTLESFGIRVGRHLTGQRTDTVAYRILDPVEVDTVELFPAQHLKKGRGDSKEDKAAKDAAMNQLEYSVYVHAIKKSKYQAILNEKIPPPGPVIDPPASQRFDLIPPDLREDREHPDVRIARRADTLARLTAVAHERGEVSAGLRRVIVIQAVRLADLAAARLSYAEGRARPTPGSIDVHALVGNVMREFGDEAAIPEDDLDEEN